jgi:transposase
MTVSSTWKATLLIDVLHSRTKEELNKCLQQYPNIRVVSRDGSQSYAAAITETITTALQVSDKFHLIKNLLEAVGSYIKGYTDNQIARQLDCSLTNVRYYKSSIKAKGHKW